MKYCPECGKILKIEMDFEKSFFTSSADLIKKCANCGTIIDTLTIKTK